MAKINLVNPDRAMKQLEALKCAGVEKVVINLYCKKRESGITLSRGGRDGFEIDFIRQLPSLEDFLVNAAGLRAYCEGEEGDGRESYAAFCWSDGIEIEFEEHIEF